jgi:hypothetical protein
MQIDIDKGVPMPSDTRVRNRYPYKLLRVGESFFVKGIALQSMYNTNFRWGRKLSRRFIARSEDGGVRVWRVE